MTELSVENWFEMKSSKTEGRARSDTDRWLEFRHKVCLFVFNFLNLSCPAPKLHVVAVKNTPK